MIQKIKSHLLLIASVLILAVPALVPAVVAADSCGTNNIASQIGSGANEASGAPATTDNCSSTGVDSSAIGKLAKGVVDVFSVIVGAVSVIMIIYGGFRYITSGGDSGGVGNAKNTIIYAIVGLVIVALAQLIVHFVLSQATTAVNNTSAPAASLILLIPRV
jgi:type IV secretion system pilin